MFTHLEAQAHGCILGKLTVVAKCATTLSHECNIRPVSTDGLSLRSAGGPCK